MKNFHYSMPTELFFGENCVKNNAQVFKSLGKRAMIITYNLPAGLRHYALEDVKEVLDSIGTEYSVSFGVKEDPPISSIEAVRAEAIKLGVDYIIAIGGGSAIDTAKCVSLLLDTDKDAYAVLFSPEPVVGVPVVAIPTTAGTGSELTCWAAVTREDIGVKCGTVQKKFPRYAFDDVRYIMELPAKITRSTVFDTLTHAVESYLNAFANPINKSHAESALKLFAQFKDSLLTNVYTKEDREKMLLASSFAGAAITETGCALSHALSYPISFNKHMPHGLACAVTLVAYLRIFKDKTEVNKVLDWCGFKDLDDMDKYMKAVMKEDVAAYSVSVAEIEAWSDEIASQKARLAAHPEPAGRPEINYMYKQAFFE